jgi:hypothetical protein
MAALERTFGPEKPKERPISPVRSAIARCRKNPKTERFRESPVDVNCVVDELRRSGISEDKIEAWPAKREKNERRRSGGRAGTSAGRYEGYGYYNGRRTSAGRSDYKTYY